MRVPAAVARDLRAIPWDRYPAVRDTISALRSTPRPPGCVKLVDRPGWRVRVGEYRIVYDIDDPAQLVTIQAVDHRRNVYR